MSTLTNHLYEFDEFRLDSQSRVLRKAGAQVSLTPKAFDVLLLLIQSAGKLVTKDELMKTVWPDSFVEESNLTQTIFMVRKALDENPDRRYILNVQGQGYRFLVPVREVAATLIETSHPESGGFVPPASPATSAPHPASPPLARPTDNKSRALIAFAAVLLILASTFWFFHARRSRAAQPEKTMLAVLPFENFTGDSTQDYFSDGLTEEMISQLGNLDPTRLGVIARTSVMHYKHTQESIPEIGRDLGVQYVIEGSVRRDLQRVRITAQLIQVKDQSHLWAREYDHDLSHLLDLQAEISREVANEIEFSLSGKRPIEASRPTGSPASGTNSYEAYDLYLKGRYFWNKRNAEGFRQAADFFQRSIDADPNYARAYAGLADTFSLMSTWYVGPHNELMPKARAAATHALQLDETVAEAHTSLALIKENYDYDWPGAEAEFRRAIQLDPQYPTAHQWYAEFLTWQGRFDEAFAESDRARQLDPLSLIIAVDHAYIFYHSHRYEDALQQCRSALALDPNFDHARNMMISSYVQLGRFNEAMDGLNRWAAHGEDGWVLAWKTFVYARSGHPEEARQTLLRLQQVSDTTPDSSPTLLVAYSGLGEKDRVIELLEKAYSEHSNAVTQIKVDPLYDPIRSDPRFEDLLRRLKLAQ